MSTEPTERVEIPLVWTEMIESAMTFLRRVGATKATLNRPADKCRDRVLRPEVTVT
jgi:hypothetical protein